MLTPGYILTDRDNVVGVTLPELAVIVAEWDRAHSWPRDVRSSEPELLLKGDRPQLSVRWYGYGTVTRLVLDRGETTAYVEAADIAEMRETLAAQATTEQLVRAAGEDAKRRDPVVGSIVDALVADILARLGASR